MTILDDPRECRLRARRCTEHAGTCRSDAARQKFFDLAKVWLMLAVQIEEGQFSKGGMDRENRYNKKPR